MGSVGSGKSPQEKGRGTLMVELGAKGRMGAGEGRGGVGVEEGGSGEIMKS